MRQMSDRGDLFKRVLHRLPLGLRAGSFAAAGLLLALCASPCRAATNSLPGLVLHLSLDEIRSGGAFADLVTGNALGRVTNARAIPGGKIGGACEFASKSSYVLVADAPALNPKQMTLSLWFKSGKDAWVSRTLLEKGMKSGYALSIAGGGKEKPNRGRLCASVNGRDCLSDAAVNDDQWHHAAATFDGDTLKLYVDGVQQKQSVACPGGIASGGHDLTLGMNRSSPSAQSKEIAYEGLLDEVMVFNRVLAEPELKKLLSTAKPKFTKQQVSRRLAELKDLLDRGLILQDFYDRKVKECEVEE